jgi:hypothetical protein
MGQLGIGLVLIVIFGLFGTLTVFALKKLLDNNRLVLDPHGNLHFYRWGARTPSRTVTPAEIKKLRLTPVSFSDEDQTYTNYLLVLTLKTGEESVLFGSLKSTYMQDLLHDFSRRLSLP